MEKRSMNRSPTEHSVACRRFSIMDGSTMHDGIMLNCSHGGSYIELDKPIDEGTIVMVKSSGPLKGPMDNEIPEGFRSVSLAEVRWSRIIDDDFMCRFGLGLKYFDV